MRCPICLSEGRRHRLSEMRVSNANRRQGPTVERYFDENDKLHVHDHEVRTFIYQCSNGHVYRHVTMSRCTQQACDWNEQPMVQNGQKGLEKVYAEQQQRRAAENAGGGADGDRGA